MQSVSSRIWTRVAVFISYDDNNYTTGNYQIYYTDSFDPGKGLLQNISFIMQKSLQSRRRL